MHLEIGNHATKQAQCNNQSMFR